MFQQYSTALVALNPSANNQTVMQLLSYLKIQVINRGQINTKENILTELELYKPNFLLVYSALPGVVDITEIISKAKQLSPKTKLIVLTTQSTSKRIQDFLTAETDALVCLDSITESLESAIKVVSKGQLFICGKTALELKNSLLEQKVQNKEDTGLLNLLTEREKEVLLSLTQGTNYKQISKLLFISESTVKTHINNIFTKLNVNDRTQAVLYALHHGIESISNKPHLLKNLVNESVQK